MNNSDNNANNGKMAFNSSGPWGSRPSGDNGSSPWGSGGGGGNGGRRPSGGGQPPEMPELEDLLGPILTRIRNFFGGGSGGKGGKSKNRMIFFAVFFTALIWLATGFYTVKANQQGVELVFGKVYDTTGPGLHYNFPAPIGEVLMPSVTSVNQEQIGFRDIAAGSGSIGKRKVIEESLMLTGDENIIDMEFVVFWRIRDAGKYLFNIRNQTDGVKATSEAAMREIIGKSAFEYARTVGRNEIAAQAQALIQNILDSYGSGIDIIRVNLQSVDPPAVVLDDFRDVQAARADKERAINEATAYSNEVIQRAQGEAEQITQNAEAYREEQVSAATGSAGRFLSIYEQYKANPSVTKRRIYLQNMEEIFGNMDKILIEENSGVVPYLPIDQLRKSPTQQGEPQ